MKNLLSYFSLQVRQKQAFHLWRTTVKNKSRVAFKGFVKLKDDSKTVIKDLLYN